MSEQQYDLVVIGAGSGGVRSARIAASLGARVAVVESRFLGGTCVNVGCVPKKMFAYASEFRDLFTLAQDYGFETGDASFDWGRLRDNKTREIERLNGVYRRLLENAGAEVIEAHGQVLAPGQVQAGDRVLHTRNIILATGGRPFVPELPGSELALISDDLFSLSELPACVAVVGGGYIATEFASILHGLGCEVHQLYRGELFLRGFDDDIRQFVADQMAESGARPRFNTDVERIEALPGNRRCLHLKGDERLDVDAVFYATGRVPNTEGLFAPEVGIALRDSGAIQVDEGYATSVPGIYALGDVTDRVQLTPVALAEGMWLARTLFAPEKPAPLSYENIATAVFCHPNIGTVGMTEAQAREKVGAVKVFRSEFRPLRYTLGSSKTRTLMKLIVDEATDKVLGLHMAGEDAGEIVQGFAVALVMGATKADFDRTLGIHPTAAEEFVTMR